MHGQETHLEYTVVTGDQIEAVTHDLPQKPWKDEQRDLVRNNCGSSLPPLVCEHRDSTTIPIQGFGDE